MSDISKGPNTSKQEDTGASGLDRKRRSLDPRNSLPEPKDHSAMKIEPKRKISAAARRALEEAETRRKNQVEKEAQTEINGRKGPDPTRYGDWEKDGIISDF